jgi:hypothetical protein
MCKEHREPIELIDGLLACRKCGRPILDYALVVRSGALTLIQYG